MCVYVCVCVCVYVCVSIPQVSTLQEVDEQKEAANELLVRLEEGKRHTVALESKLDSFNTQVAAAISPLHTRCESPLHTAYTDLVLADC